MDMTKNRSWGIIWGMPTYRKFSPYNSDLMVEVRPYGYRNLFRILPYFTGSNLRILLNINIIKGGNGQLPHRSELYIIMPGEKWRQVPCHEVTIRQTNNNMQSEVSAFIAIPGSYVLQLTFNNKLGETSETIIEFHAHSKDIAQLNLAILLIGAVIGAVISWILTHI